MNNNKQHPKADAKVGDVLHYSWGYSMTLNDFCVVKKVSAKSIVCQMVSSKWVGGDAGYTGSVAPDASSSEGESQKEFRLFAREGWNGGEVWYVGSYPYCGDSMHRGVFSKVKEGQSFYENHMD